MADAETLREAAFLEFSSEFTNVGLHCPEKLTRMLRKYVLRTGESSEQMRSRIYRRIWAILWYGNKVGKGKWSGSKDKPTYVFPDCLKKVVRAVIPGDIVDSRDPTGVNVYSVTMEDLSSAKWP